MVWTVKPRPAKVLADLDANLTWESPVMRYRVLRSCLAGFTYYAAVECVGKDGSRDVVAAVSLVRYFRDGTIGIKDMDESMGPNEARCPRTILKLLTPTTDDVANDWRRRCRVWHGIEPLNRPDSDDSLPSSVGDTNIIA